MDDLANYEIFSHRPKTIDQQLTVIMFAKDKSVFIQQSCLVPLLLVDAVAVEHVPVGHQVIFQQILHFFIRINVTESESFNTVIVFVINRTSHLLLLL